MTLYHFTLVVEGADLHNEANLDALYEAGCDDATFGVAARVQHADLEALSQLIQAVHVTPIIDKTYPLAEVPAAVRHLEAGHARGKIAITI